MVEFSTPLPKETEDQFLPPTRSVGASFKPGNVVAHLRGTM